MSLRKVWAVALKELRQASRDKLTLIMLTALPTLILLMYGYAINFDVRHVALAVEDRDKTAASRDLVASFVNSTYFDLALDLPAGEDLGKVTQRRLAKAVLVIPEGLARTLAEGRQAPVQLILDGTDSNTATLILGYAQAVVGQVNTDRQRAAAQGALRLLTPPIDVQPRVWYNPELRSTQFLVPGLIGFILMLTAVLSTALSVVREKERGTMEQLRVTSLRPAELIIGKTIPYLVISLVATGLILIAARVLFGIVVRGSYFELFLATLVYLIGALGFGLLVSSIADTQAMAFQMGTVASMLPAIFLSGFIFPIKSMPLAVQAITYVVPARYFLVILRGIILKGAPLSTYTLLGGQRSELGFLLLYGAVVLSLAYFRLTRREV